jgi:hypothetical protein
MLSDNENASASGIGDRSETLLGYQPVQKTCLSHWMTAKVSDLPYASVNEKSGENVTRACVEASLT